MSARACHRMIETTGRPCAVEPTHRTVGDFIYLCEEHAKEFGEVVGGSLIRLTDGMVVSTPKRRSSAASRMESALRGFLLAREQAAERRDDGP